MSADLLGATPGVDFPAAVAAFRAAESAAIDAWRSDLDRADWASPDEYRAAYNASSRDYEDSIATALYTLESAIAGDPLGQWITANALRSWTDDALTVLENLPCTGQELHEVARSEGWCATWWNLWSQAVRDGVVTDVSSVRRMIDALAERGVTATWESTGGGFCDIISAPYVRDGTIARVSSYLAALNLAVALSTESVCVVPECGEPVAERGACEGQWCPEHWAEHTREYPACAALYWAAVKASEW